MCTLCSKTQVPKIFKVLNWKLHKYTTAIMIAGLHDLPVFFCVREVFQKMHSYFIKLLEGACHIQIPVLLRDGCMELSFTHA
jgi:hypothetical protein